MMKIVPFGEKLEAKIYRNSKNTRIPKTIDLISDVAAVTWRRPDPASDPPVKRSAREERRKKRNMIPIGTRTSLGCFASARSQLHVLGVRTFEECAGGLFTKKYESPGIVRRVRTEESGCENSLATGIPRRFGGPPSKLYTAG